MTFVRHGFRKGMLAVLRVESFRYLFVSNGLWWLAMWMEFLGVGWIALELTDSVFLVALVGFTRMLPLSLVGLFSGLIIDRFGRRRTIVSAQFIHFATATVMVLLFFSGKAEYWHLLTSALIFGAAWSVDFPARRSLIPDLVGKEMTSDAVICEGLAMNMARILGPLAAGCLIKFSGPLGFYLFLGWISMSALLILRRLPHETIPRDTMPPAGSPFIQLREGFRYARSHHVILAVFLITVVVNLFLISYMTMLPVIARDVLLLDASGLGFIGMAVGMGALPGIVIVHKVKRFISEGLIYTVGTLGFSLAIVLFATSLSFPLSFCALLLGGVGHSCFGLMQSTLILTSATDAMRSRVMGLIVVAIGIGPIGQLLVGVLASRFGAPFAVQMSASLATLAIIFVMVLLPQIWRSDSPVESRR